MTLSDQKSALRVRALQARAGFDPNAGERLAAMVLGGLRPACGRVVGGVWPMPGEMDLRPLLLALHRLGNPVVLPETPPRGQALIFRLWHPGAEMVRERFGTFRPTGDTATPDLLFVPLLAFDRKGGRLGYGGGYYDRTLAAFDGIQATGYGYAAQEVAQVPMEPHDRRLTTIVTESEIIRTTV